VGRVLEIFTPSVAQRQLYDRLQRFNVLVCHRGFGKSYLAVNLLIRQAVKKPGTAYAFLTDTYQHAKDIAWEKILKRCLAEAAELGVVKFWEADLRVTFANGSEIKLYGVDTRPEALRGLHLDGVVFDEYALIPPHVWEQIVFPTLQRKRGGAIFIGTPQGRNHFYRLYQDARTRADWFAATVRVDESGALGPEEIALAKTTLTPEAYAQEYECSFETAIHGAYYALELRAAREQGRVRQVAWEASGEPVQTWWDVGHTDATAIIFSQSVGREIHLVDYVEARGRDLAFYAKALQDRPYLYGDHLLPHDAAASRLEAAGRSLVRQLQDLGLKGVRVGKPSDPLVGINAARLLFGRCWFDQDKCSRLLDALAFYHAKPDVKNETEKAEPQHDWSSHAADAFRYLALGIRDYVTKTPSQRYAATEFDRFGDYRRPGPRVALGSLSS